MPKVRLKKQLFFTLQLSHLDLTPFDSPFDSQNKGKGGKNRRRGKNENDDDKRELVFREDGQGEQFRQLGTYVRGDNIAPAALHPSQNMPRSLKCSEMVGLRLNASMARRD